MKIAIPQRVSKAALIIIALAGLNACFLTLAARPAELPLAEWRKGPVIHKNAFYGPARAPQYFWFFTALFLDLYALAAWGFGIAIVRPGRHVTATRLFAATGALVFAMALTEGAVRRTAAKSKPGHFRPHPDVFYYNRPLLRDSREFPNALPESTSSRGFRGRDEFPNAKPPGEYRIAVLGDSSAFGHGVLDSETFSAQLETILREWVQGPVRVINAACPGHCTYEGLIILKLMIAPLNPDLVIVAYNNDASPEYQEEKQRAYAPAPLRALLRILYHSDFFLLFQRTVANATLKARLKTGDAPPTVPRVSLNDHVGNLLAFQEQAARLGAKAVYLNMPINHEFLEQTPERNIFYNPLYPKSLLELCRQNNLPLVDIDGELTRTPLPSIFLKGHHFHPSAHGHRIIAEQIAPVIIPLMAERMHLRSRVQPGAATIQTQSGEFEGAPPEPIPGESLPQPADMPEWRRVVRLGYSTLTPLHTLFGETLQKTSAAADAGLIFQFMPFLHGKDQDEAYAQDMVDLSFSCEVPAIIHLDRHRDLQIIGTAGELGHVALLVSASSPVRGVAQLKGKTVAVADGASARMLLEQWLKNENLDPARDVQISMFKGNTSEAIEAMTMGVADAAVLWDPWLTEYAQNRQLRVIKYAPFTSLILLSKTYANARPENIPDIMRALALALDWARANPDPAAFFVSQAGDLPIGTVRHVLAKNRFLQTNAPQDFRIQPDIMRHLRACRVFAIQNRLASPDVPLICLDPGVAPAASAP